MVTKEEVLKLAALAHLEFTEDELEKLINDMDEIIAFADAINGSVEGDSENIRNVSAVSVSTDYLREDVVEPSLSKEKILSNAKSADGMFCVKGGI